jgi:hypothetical protein
MSYYNVGPRSKAELLSLAYRLCLYLIVPVAALLPACGFHGSHPGYFDPCSGLAVAGPRLVYPVPSASDVPTTPNDLIFVGLPVGSDITTSLVPASGGANTLQLGAFIVAPSPIPSPAASYAPTTTLYAVAYPALDPNTTYTIQYGTLASGPCPLIPTSSGSFTTS